MHKHFNLYIIEGIIFTLIFGTLLHFVYEWSDYNAIVGIFSPVNESVWEHLKLLYYPITLWTFYGFFKFGRKSKNFIFSSLIGLLCGFICIPVLFYAYTTMLGTNYLIADIVIYAISVIIHFFTMKYIFKNYNIQKMPVKICIFLWEFIFILFVIFTIFPPDIFIFKS